MRVFVLSTGRCGSTTFVHACRHLTNYTAGHETRAHKAALAARLDYPVRHIEADNRLTWFLGPLAARYADAFFVHLTRDRDEVVSSFLRRWDQGMSSIVRAFGHGILIRTDEFGSIGRERVASMYVDTVTETITEFLRERNHLRVKLETVDVDFSKFLDCIGAEGDRDAALAEWAVRYNAHPALVT